MNLKTILTSLVTSIIVSAFTFVLGLKSGKNQADRAFLQELYKQLYAHFSELEKGIKENRPKKWVDYKSIKSGNRIQYYPVAKEMERTGDLIFLNNAIANRALVLEMLCLNYENEIVKRCKLVHDYLVNSKDLFVGELENETNLKDTRYLMKTKNPTSCRSFREENYGVLLDPETLKDVLNKRDNDEMEYAIIFRLKSELGKTERQITIFPQSIATDNISFSNKINEYIVANVNRSEIDKGELLKKLKILKKQLKKRAKNPTGFWETVLGAFLDIIRN